MISRSPLPRPVNSCASLGFSGTWNSPQLIGFQPMVHVPLGLPVRVTSKWL
ncbi:hypothetical protein AVEN_202677-1, partial [Araneus ventricosus]